MKRIILLIVSSVILLFAEDKGRKEITGQVTFLSSQNIYVKFDKTDGIFPGDTLFIQQENVLRPAMVVKFVSSRSAAGPQILGVNIKIDQYLIAFVKLQEEAAKTNNQTVIPDTLAIDTKVNIPDKKTYYPEKKNFYGRFSVQSFSSMSNFSDGSDEQRWRYSFSLNADEISNTPLSLSSYLIFSYRNGDLNNMKSDLSPYLKIYDLGVKYKFGNNAEIWLGRHMNRSITNISAIDGLQFENKFKYFSLGLVAGSRPDFTDMGFNFKLFEYGGYIVRTDTIKGSSMENTVAFMQQTNNFKTDRRFLYIQHNNELVPKVNLFYSSEIDLFERVNNQNRNTFSLTGLFVSARYSPVNELSLTFSYDARKDVIYYETYRSTADSIIQHETREGIRGGINLRIVEGLFIGANAGYRFQKSDTRASKNYNFYISYVNLPLVDIIPSFNYSKLESNYLDGTIWGARISKNIYSIIDLGVEYKKSLYNFGNENLRQHIFSADLSFRLTNFLYLTSSYEGTYELTHSWSRVLFDLGARF